MAAIDRDEEYGNAPEVNPHPQPYIPPVHDQSPPYAVLSPKGYEHVPRFETQTELVGSRKGWTRWWILAIIGIGIAIIAGVVGGFIGRAIQQGQGSSNAFTAQTSSAPAATAIPSPENSSSSATTPPPNQPPGTIGTIVLPNTGCNFPTSKERRRISNATEYTKTGYTTVCNSGWINAGLSGFWTLTPSDCVEACVQYNKFLQDRNSKALSCVGGGFIPDFTNRSLAKLISNGAPFNCYLQYNSDGIVPNDREKSGLEVVALCLDGMCKGAGTA
jgi:hypothetical protein